VTDEGKGAHYEAVTDDDYAEGQDAHDREGYPRPDELLEVEIRVDRVAAVSRGVADVT